MTLLRIPKNKKSLCEPPFQDLGVTYALHLQIVGKIAVDFLFVIIEFFRYILRLRSQTEICQSRHLSKGVGHFEAHSQVEQLVFTPISMDRQIGECRTTTLRLEVFTYRNFVADFYIEVDFDSKIIGHFRQIFDGEGGIAHQPVLVSENQSDCRFVWYQNIRSASFSFVTIYTHLTDRRTDRQNCDSNTVCCITCRTVKMYVRPGWPSVTS